jgi:hypothetical protein
LLVNEGRFRKPTGTDRRAGHRPDTGARRRESDPKEDFALFRDKVLLLVGVLIVVVISFSAIALNIKSPEVALAGLAAGAGFLGAPSFLKIDENRRRRDK